MFYCFGEERLKQYYKKGRKTFVAVLIDADEDAYRVFYVPTVHGNTEVES